MAVHWVRLPSKLVFVPPLLLFQVRIFIPPEAGETVRPGAEADAAAECGVVETRLTLYSIAPVRSACRGGGSRVTHFTGEAHDRQQVQSDSRSRNAFHAASDSLNVKPRQD